MPGPVNRDQKRRDYSPARATTVLGWTTLVAAEPGAEFFGAGDRIRDGGLTSGSASGESSSSGTVQIMPAWSSLSPLSLDFHSMFPTASALPLQSEMTGARYSESMAKALSENVWIGPGVERLQVRGFERPDWVIYGLAHPLEGSIRYLGKTLWPPTRRFKRRLSTTSKEDTHCARWFPGKKQWRS